MHLLSEERDQTHDLPTAGGPRTARVQIDCDALSFADSDELAQAAVDAIDAMRLRTNLGVTLNSCRLEDKHQQVFEMPSVGSGIASNIFRTTHIFSINYN